MLVTLHRFARLQGAQLGHPSPRQHAALAQLDGLSKAVPGAMARELRLGREEASISPASPSAR